MRWWDDLWLNESFAEYLGHLVAGQITELPVWADFSARRKVGGYAADRRRTTHPIAGNGAPDARAALDDFDAISYAKGASVVRGLSAYLGDEMFLGGLRDHIKDHEYGNATFADLLASWQAHADPATPSADDLARWAGEWLRTPGVDSVAVEPGTSGVVLTRKPPTFGPPARRPHAMTVAVLPDGPVADVLLDGDTVEVPLVATGPDEIVLPNSGDQTWATIDLAAPHWPRLPAVLSTLADPTARGVLWGALRSAVDDGTVSPALAVRTVVAGLPRELDVVAERLLPWITDAVAMYLAPGAERDDALARVTDASATMLGDAAPGSSRQLTAAHGWLAVTTDVDVLRRWSTDDTGIDGLEVDDELRWAVLARRAELGDVSTDQIEAAYTADRSASGLMHAAYCRAARPDATGKAATWASLVDPASTLSQYELNALAGGLWVAGQEDLVAPYASRWFDEIPSTSAFRGGWALTRIAASCFPALHVEADTFERAEQLAARTDVPSGLRRVASDGADDLRRAIAVRGASAVRTALDR
jgi:aminopeptidase N